MVVYLTFVVNYKLVYVPSLLILFLLEVDQLVGISRASKIMRSSILDLPEVVSMPLTLMMQLYRLSSPRSNYFDNARLVAYYDL